MVNLRAERAEVLLFQPWATIVQSTSPVSTLLKDDAFWKLPDLARDLDIRHVLHILAATSRA